MTTPTSHYTAIADSLHISTSQVKATAELLDQGATIPFISRYRKEATNSLDEVAVTAIRDQLSQLAALDKRREAMLGSLRERDLLTEKLHGQLNSAGDLPLLEDIYLPHRPKRRTRALIARERGLEPLASAIFTANDQAIQPTKYINPAEEVHSVDDAQAGARDIIAEWISERQAIRTQLREKFRTESLLTSKVIEKKRAEGGKYRDYFDCSDKAASLPSHRLLAMLRGEREKILKLTVRPDEKRIITLLERALIKKPSHRSQMELAIGDAYKRLLMPSLENELRIALKTKADQEAIGVFAANTKELLLAPPLGQKRVMALDPGFRTGAKLVCLDEQGTLLHSTTIYPTQGAKKQEEAAAIVSKLLHQFSIEAIAIGNGTASRETEQFVQSLTRGSDILVTLVNEDGASIYSASEVARKEFPDHDLTVRGAVSIGRRLQDPLAELVKIDPKSMGVGQYQHDVDQSALRKSLEDVVSSCVNSVGVELNSASVELLTHVSGLGPVLAGNIVQYRLAHGPFTSRKELLKVPRLGAKAFEQCAGFLRIHGAAHPLDGSGVHPERYATVASMANDLGVSIIELMQNSSLRQSIALDRYTEASLGLPTLQDIMTELAKPGRDPRPPFQQFAFAADVHTVDDLVEGMRLPGIVTNVTKFGAFVDIGIHQDGLIHISQLANRFVKDPGDIVKINQQLTVRVLQIDKERGRIGLSLKDV